MNCGFCGEDITWATGYGTQFMTAVKHARCRDHVPRAKLTFSAARVGELARPEMPFSVLAADAMGMKYAVCEFAEICTQLGTIVAASGPKSSI